MCLHVKLSKRCQMSKSQTSGLWRRLTKKMTQWGSQILMLIFTSDMMMTKNTQNVQSVFDQFWWPSHVTSKLMSICVNLIMSIFLCTSSIVHMFDFLTLTSFDILIKGIEVEKAGQKGHECWIQRVQRLGMKGVKGAKSWHKGHEIN